MSNNKARPSHAMSAYSQISPSRPVPHAHTPGNQRGHTPQNTNFTRTPVNLPTAPRAFFKNQGVHTPHSAGFRGPVPPPPTGPPPRSGPPTRLPSRVPPTRPSQSQGPQGALPSRHFGHQRSPVTPQAPYGSSQGREDYASRQFQQQYDKGHSTQDQEFQNHLHSRQHHTQNQVQQHRTPQFSARVPPSFNGQDSLYHGDGNTWTMQDTITYPHLMNTVYGDHYPHNPQQTPDTNQYSQTVQESQLFHHEVTVYHKEQHQPLPPWSQAIGTNTPLSQNPHHQLYNQALNTPQLFVPPVIPSPSHVMQSQFVKPEMVNYFELDFAEIKKEALHIWSRCCALDSFERFFKKYQSSARSLKLIVARDPRISDDGGNEAEKRPKVIILLVEDINTKASDIDIKLKDDSNFEEFSKCPLWFDHSNSFFFDFGTDKHRENIARNDEFIDDYFGKFGKYAKSIESNLLKISGDDQFVKSVCMCQNIGVSNKRRILADFVADYSLWAKDRKVSSDDEEEEDSVVLTHPTTVPSRHGKPSPSKVVKPSTKVQLRNSLSIPPKRHIPGKLIQPVQEVDLTNDGHDISNDCDTVMEDQRYDTAELADHIQKELDSPVGSAGNTSRHHGYGSTHTEDPLVLSTAGTIPPEIEKEDGIVDDLESLFGTDDGMILPEEHPEEHPEKREEHYIFFAGFTTTDTSEAPPVPPGAPNEISHEAPEEDESNGLEMYEFDLVPPDVRERIERSKERADPVVVSELEDDEDGDVPPGKATKVYIDEIEDLEDVNADEEDDDEEDDDGTELLEQQLLSEAWENIRNSDGYRGEANPVVLSDREEDDKDDDDDDEVVVAEPDDRVRPHNKIQALNENNSGFSDALANGIIRENLEHIPSLEELTKLNAMFLFLDYSNEKVTSDEMANDIRDRLSDTMIELVSIHYKERSAADKRFCLQFKAAMDVFHAVKCLHGVKYRNCQIIASLCEDAVAKDFIQMNRVAYQEDSEGGFFI